MKVKTHITKKQRANQDCKDFFFENFSVGSLTTEHPASSYGQPVVVENGKVLNYSDIESLTVEADEATVAGIATQLEPFGVRVSRHRRKE